METALLFILVWSVWHFFIVSVRDSNGGNIQGITTSNIIGQYMKRHQTPRQHLLLWEDNRQVHSFTWTGAMYSISSRPVSGDHIHMAMSIWIGDKQRQAEHDRPVRQDIPYEFKENICQYPGNVAYTKLWPHVGVHTHCDGLIHVHPWSAPKAIRQEGRRAVLGLWFDQVGIQYRQNSVEFRDGKCYDNNATHKWRIAEYSCYSDNEYRLYEDDFDNIWLGHAYSSYVMWFGVSNKPPPSIETHIAHLKRVRATGFDGKPYPQTCLRSQ